MTCFSLHPFPGQNSGGVSIQGAIERTGRTIVLSFVLHGKVADILLLPTTETTRCDNLWQSTCFEMFWAEEGEKNYWELNLAPTGAWNIYALTEYRKGMLREERIARPHFQTERTAERFSCTATMELALLLAAPPLRVGISTVLEHRDGRLSYWALGHPADKPDFHAPQGFLLRV